MPADAAAEADARLGGDTFVVEEAPVIVGDDAGDEASRRRSREATDTSPRRRARPPLVWIGAGAAALAAVVLIAVVASGGGGGGGDAKNTSPRVSASGKAARAGAEDRGKARAAQAAESGESAGEGGASDREGSAIDGDGDGAVAGSDGARAGAAGVASGSGTGSAAGEVPGDEVAGTTDDETAAAVDGEAEGSGAAAAVELPVPVPVPKARPRAAPTLGGKRVVLEYDAPRGATKQPAKQKIVGAAKDDTAAVGAARITYFSGNRRLYAGDAEGAIRLYRQALGMYPGYVAGYRGLGLAYAQKGDRANALRAFRTYIGAVPNAKDVALIRKRIAGLQRRK